VLAPTRELAEQLAGEAQPLVDALELRQALLVGGVSDSAQRQSLDDGVDLVVATPGRLLDLHSRGWLVLDEVRCFAVDEVDQLLDLGFVDDLSTVAAALPPHQTLMVTATLPEATEALAARWLSEPVVVRGEGPVHQRNVVQWVCYVRQADKVALLQHLLGTLDGRVIVFRRTRAAVDLATSRLQSAGIEAVGLHGQRTQAQRSEALAAFVDGTARVLVATDVAARGLHLEGVEAVVHADLCAPDTYVHRTGRAGRLGRDGVAYALCDPGEHGLLAAIESQVGKPLQPRLDHPFHDHGLIPGRPKPKRGRRTKRRRR
jgi:ATP-dependent RNA helicase RhlE